MTVYMTSLKDKKRFRSQYDEIPEVYTENNEYSCTQYVPLDCLNVRYYIDRLLGGYLDHNPQPGEFLDLTNLDYQEALETVAEAEQAFDELPIRLKQRFGTPENFLQFLDNPQNFDEAVRLNLINPKYAENVYKQKETLQSEKAERESLEIANNRSRDGLDSYMKT